MKNLPPHGEPDVPFRLTLGRVRVFGTFDRLIPHGNGYEIGEPSADADNGNPRLKLLALALFRTGRAALNEGRVVVHRLAENGGEPRIAAFPVDELERAAAVWSEQLENR